jgi:hypothetical protein
MNLEKSTIFSVIAIVVTVVLFAGAAIVADHQALAFSGHRHGGAYGFYGPCIIKGYSWGTKGFSFTWCLNRL